MLRLVLRRKGISVPNSLPRVTDDVIRRGLHLQHLTADQETKARSENVSYLDYALVQRERSIFIKNTYKKRYDIEEGITKGDVEARMKNVKVRSLPAFYEMVQLKFSGESVSDNLLEQGRPRTRGNERVLESSFVSLMSALHESSDMMIDAINETNNDTISHKKPDNKRSDTMISRLISLYSTGSDTQLLHNQVSINSKDQQRKRIQNTLSTLLSSKTYHFEDIVKWVACVTSPSITDACFSIYGVYKVPQFLIDDLLSRVPKSTYEVRLLVEIYELFCSPSDKKDATTNQDHQLSFDTVVNLVHYMKMFDVENLMGLLHMITDTLEFDNMKFNKLIATIADTSFTSFDVDDQNNREYLTHIIQSQRFLYEVMINRDLELNSFGKMSIGLTVLPLSRDRSLKIFNSIERQDLITKEELEVYNILDLLLDESPSSMIRKVDGMIQSNTMTSKCWHHFSMRIKQFDSSYHHSVFRKSNIPKLLSTYGQYSFMTKSQSSLHNQLKSADAIINTFQGTNYFDNRSISALLFKLYNSPKTKPLKTSYSSIFTSNLSYARYIFSNLQTPSQLIIGKILVEESKLDPQGAYNRYLNHLKSGPSDIPNENYLESLIIPSITDRNLIWEDESGSRYASQIAVHEFRKFIMMPEPQLTTEHEEIVPSSSPIFRASETLWRHYILLLARVNYEHELSEILPFWEASNYAPTRKTLTMLLSALPYRNGEMIRRHAVDNLVDVKKQAFWNKNVDDNEKKISELGVLGRFSWPGDKEIEYWRELIFDEKVELKKFLVH